MVSAPGSTLYFYSESELSRTFITPRAMTAERLYQMLRQSAVFAPQLPATLAPGGAMIVVSGPPTLPCPGFSRRHRL